MTDDFIRNEKYTKQLLKHIPDGMFGNAVDLAKFIIFLAGETCRHINGANFIIDGGMLNVIEGGIEK